MVGEDEGGDAGGEDEGGGGRAPVVVEMRVKQKDVRVRARVKSR
jgi:hypothetical protein